MEKYKNSIEKTSLDFRTITAITITLLFWASAFAGIRLGLKFYNPNHLVALRFISSSLTLYAYAIVIHLPLPKKKDVLPMFILGFIGITVYHVALTYGEIKVTAGSASLIVAAGPIFTAILAMFILKEKIKIWGWIGIFTSFLGIALVTLGEGKTIGFEPASFFILLSAFSASVYFVLQKPYLKKYSPVQFATYTIWTGTFFILFLSKGLFQSIISAPVGSTLAIVYLGIFPAALGYITWSYVLSKIPASSAGSYLYLSPLLAILIALIWLGELPSLLSLFGGILTLTGVIIVNIRKK